ncbi:MAG: sigma-54-dependent Fis family transcriptional regulator [Algicola sp.]|nr:sigma-54-dependent Fis family transcriptional regulator [Algicola sp.]
MISVIESNIIGQSASITQVRALIKINAQYPAPVLITGETGTGKELAARGLHYSGVFANKPFIAVNCSTFTDELFASELFGYKKGAFTDAKTDKEGLLKAACGGSMFLDEIDSLSLKSQAALLRLLQESEYRPIGSSVVIKANVRVIAAANCDLTHQIRSGAFRQDLYFRLFILTVRMPPLRERKEDLPQLIEFFIAKLNSQYSLKRTGICARLMDKLQQHDWPGNVRELENTIHRHYLMAGGALLSDNCAIDIDPRAATTANTLSGTATDVDAADWQAATHKPQQMVTGEGTNALEINSCNDESSLDFVYAKRKAVEAFEARFVSNLMHHAKGNVTKAASLCGKERRAFGKLVKKYNINRANLQLG